MELLGYESSEEEEKHRYNKVSPSTSVYNCSCTLMHFLLHHFYVFLWVFYSLLVALPRRNAVKFCCACYEDNKDIMYNSILHNINQLSYTVYVACVVDFIISRLFEQHLKMYAHV